jgi:hypothetical protein
MDSDAVAGLVQDEEDEEGEDGDEYEEGYEDEEEGEEMDDNSDIFPVDEEMEFDGASKKNAHQKTDFYIIFILYF